MIFTVWGKASYTAVPNSDLFREEDFLSALEGLTPLPKPASSPTDSAESMALLEQYVANQTNIRTAAEAVMNDALDALCARVGLTNIRTRRAVFGMPEAPAPGEAFTWEGHCESHRLHRRLRDQGAAPRSRRGQRCAVCAPRQRRIRAQLG